MDDARKYIVEKLNSMSPESARTAITNGTIYVGDIDSPNYKFAFSLIEAKESALREVREAENLVISRKALRTSYIAIIIAIIAMILPIIVAFFNKK